MTERRSSRAAASVAAGLLAVSAAIPSAAQPESLPPVAPADSYPKTSNRTVDYVIAVELDPGEKTIAGTERVTWRNGSADTVGELWFHLYLNAWKNESSSSLRERRGRDRRGEGMRPGEWGWIDVTSLKSEAGADLLPALAFEHPDDDNADDRTVARVTLPAPVPPGGSVTVEIGFKARFPHAIGRTGYHDDYFMAAQWFPKLGVYEGKGRGMPGGNGWNCHQYHGSGEFYADFGTYEVSVTTPARYEKKVGGTGRIIREEKSKDADAVTTTFRAEDVHDFAWVADPDFVVSTYTFEGANPDNRDQNAEMMRLRTDVFRFGSDRDFGLRDVEVRILLQPEHERLAERHRDAAMNALRYFGIWFGPYPYDTLTLVDPAHNAGATGGMEYPTLITLGASLFSPRATHSPEGIITHEFGHQYWYGLVANNEFEESWLDEGFTSYTEDRARRRLYPDFPDRIDSTRYAGFTVFATPLLELPSRLDRGDVRRVFFLSGAGVPLGNPFLDYLRDLPFLNFLHDVPSPARETRRARYLSDTKADPMVRNSWEYLSPQSYRINSYDKPALFLMTLEGLLGEDAWLRVLRTYQQRFRFRHPTSADFLAVLNEVSGSDHSALFDQVVRGSNVLDYAVTEVTSRKKKESRGVFDGPEGRKFVGPRPGEDEPDENGDDDDEESSGGTDDDGPEGAIFESEVVVRRLGEVIVPVEIEIRFEREPSIYVGWDGVDRWKRFRFEKKSRLEWAKVDPKGKLALDVDPSNNGLRREPDRRAPLMWSVRFLQWLQNAMHHYTRYS